MGVGLPQPGQILIRDIAESVNVDVSFPAAVYLAVCEGLIGARCKVQIKRGWYEPSIIWAAIIGRPSSGKTPAIDAIMEPLKSIEKKRLRHLKQNSKLICKLTKNTFSGQLKKVVWTLSYHLSQNHKPKTVGLTLLPVLQQLTTICEKIRIKTIHI